jgi:hypothetical protein
MELRNFLISVSFFQICYDFWTILKILEFGSIQKWADYNLNLFSQPLVRMMQIIWCWIGNERVQFFCILSFLKFCTNFKQFENAKFGCIYEWWIMIWSLFFNRLSEWCKLYVVGKVGKMCNLLFYPIRHDLWTICIVLILCFVLFGS